MRKIGAAAIVAGGLAVATPATAQTVYPNGGTLPTVGSVDTGITGAVLSTSGSREGAVLASQAQLTPPAAAAQGTSSGLAFTGADIAGLTMLGAVSIGIGVIVVRSGRRKSADSESAGPFAAG